MRRDPKAARERWLQRRTAHRVQLAAERFGNSQLQDHEATRDAQAECDRAFRLALTLSADIRDQRNKRATS